MREAIGQIINTQIIPVLLLPVTGLLLLVLYNKFFSMNHRIRTIQDKLDGGGHPPQQDQKVQMLKLELQKLHVRTRVLFFAIVCCLASVFFFSLSALCIALSLFFPGTIQMALFFWFFGPVLICLGVGAAILELFSTIRTIFMQSNLN